MKKLDTNINGYAYNILLFIIGLVSSILVAFLFFLLHIAIFPNTEMALIILPLITGLPIGIITGYLIVDKFIFNSTANNISIYLFEGIIYLSLSVFIPFLLVEYDSSLLKGLGQLLLLVLINLLSLLVHKLFIKKISFDKPNQ
jgi:hypothetical protein